jgi:hypothetical protein
VVELPDGSSAFLKIAAFDYTGDWLRDERRACELLDAEQSLPRLPEWDDDGVAPVLALEDLSDRLGHRPGRCGSSICHRPAERLLATATACYYRAAWSPPRIRTCSRSSADAVSG